MRLSIRTPAGIIKKFITYVILCCLCLFLSGCDKFVKIHKTPDLKGRIINLTEIRNSELQIRGEFCLARFQGGFFQAWYETYNDKTFTARISKNGDFHMKPRKLYTRHKAKLWGNIELTIKDPEILKEKGKYDSLGSTSWEIDTLGDPSRKDYSLEQNSFKLSVSEGFAEKIEAIIPSVLKLKYGHNIEFRHVVTPTSEKYPNKFPEWAEYFSDDDAFPESRYSELAYKLKKDTPSTLSFTSLALIPANYPMVAEHTYVILNMKNTMGGERWYVVWHRFVEKQINQSAVMDSVFLDEKVLEQIISNIRIHERRVQLGIAIDEGDVQKCEYLFSIGVSPNSLDDVGYPFLLRAAQTGDIAIIKSFLTHGADPNLKNPYGDTFLDWLEENTKKAISPLLRGKS